MIKHKLPTFIFMAVLGLYAGNVHAANKYNEPCDEITASSDIAVTSTQYGKVAGYLENNIFTFKGVPYAKAERFMPPVAPTNGTASVVHELTDLPVRRQNVWGGSRMNKHSLSTGTTVFPEKTACA